MPSELEVRLRAHLRRLDGTSELLFTNRSGRPLCADKLREKQLHPLCQGNCATATRESRLESRDTSLEINNVQNRSARLVN